MAPGLQLYMCSPEAIGYWSSVRTVLQADCNEFLLAVLTKYNLTLESTSRRWSSSPEVMGRLVPKFQFLFSEIFERVQILIESEKTRDKYWVNSMITSENEATVAHRTQMLRSHVDPRHHIMDTLWNLLEKLCASLLFGINSECK